jgi:transposase
MQTQRNTLELTGQNIYVGFDAHLKSWNVSIMVEDVFFKTFSQPACPLTLYKYLSRNFPNCTYHSAYEAGFSGFWAHYELTRLGVKSIVVNPSDIPTTGKEKVQKTDSRDSRKIVRSLRSGELKPIHIPSTQTINDRSLVRTRKTIVNDLCRYKNRIKSFLYFNGISYPEQFSKAGTHWSKRFMKWLFEIEFESTAKLSIDVLLTQATELRKQLLNVNRQIRILSKSERYNENVSLLLSVPGIGLTTAMTILTELENINRFHNLDELCGFIGLVPSTRDSGNKESIRNITPRGHHVMRKTIIESSWIAIRTDPVLCRSYYEYCKRMEPNKAIIRIAKKLISRIKFVLTEKQKYQHCIVKSNYKINQN